MSDENKTAAPGEYVSLIEELKQNEFDYYGPVMVRAADALAAMQAKVASRERECAMIYANLKAMREKVTEKRNALSAAQARIAALTDTAVNAARKCFWSEVGGGRVVSRQASPDEVEAAIRAAIKGGEDV